jgi:hypothetical protein
MGILTITMVHYTMKALYRPPASAVASRWSYLVVECLTSKNKEDLRFRSDSAHERALKMAANVYTLHPFYFWAILRRLVARPQRVGW